MRKIFALGLILLTFETTGQVYIDLKQLKDAGGDINKFPPQDLLSLGVGNCDMELIRSAISKGADLNKQIEGAGFGYFPLCIAISAACNLLMPPENSIIANLIKEGGTGVYDGRSPDQLRRDYIEMMKFFLQKGAKATVAPDYDAGNIPLLIAARYRDIEIVRLLLDSKADPNSLDNMGFTALHILGQPEAVPYPYKNGPEIAKLLISRGAKMSKAVDEEGGSNGPTPLSVVKSNLNNLRSEDASHWRELPFYNEIINSFESLIELYNKP